MVRLETQPALTIRTDCLDGTDACVTPVLEKDEAPSHPHNKARASFLPSGLPGPAPRLSRTPASASSGGDSLEWGAHTMEILAEEGYDQVNPPLLFYECPPVARTPYRGSSRRKLLSKRMSNRNCSVGNYF